MKRLLCIVGKMDVGGAETFIMKVFRRIDRTLFQIDFAVASREPGFYDNEILALGGHIHYITPKSKGLIANYTSIKKLVKAEGYMSVLRISQNSLSALELMAARRGGAKKLIFRSSNTHTMTSGFESYVHRACMFMPKLFANVKVAPSTEAAEFMFGKNCIKKNKAYLLNNGIDLSIYSFNEKSRERIRSEYKLDGCFVLGHVGRFNNQKNHLFLLDVFSEVKKKVGNAKLVLIGDGELHDAIVAKITELEIQDDVLLLGKISHVPDVLCAMDVFVFPSIYEGMPNVVIEAQCSGLNCILSSSITKEADVTGTVKYIDLNEKPERWAEIIATYQGQNRIQNASDILKKCGYDISDVVSKFIELMY